MGKKVISHIKFDDTISLSECADGFYLYDTTIGMNISMYKKAKDDAFFDALKYYQKRLMQVEKSHNELKLKVDNFVNLFIDNDDNCIDIYN